MRIFDSDGAPISYERLGSLAPDPGGPWRITGRLYAEIPITNHETNTDNDQALIRELVEAYRLGDADVLDFDMEDQ